MRSRIPAGPAAPVVDVIAAIALAVAARLVIGPAFPNFDALYALVWGDQIAHGRTPDYFSPDAPAPHPLTEAVGMLLSPFGAAFAIGAVRAIGLLAIGALCVGLYRLGEALSGRLVGFVAAAIMATRVPTLVFGAGAYVDIPATALIVWAAVLEARRPRRGVPVLVLLAVAGLLRAEVWLLSLVYLVWLLPRFGAADRVRAAAVAAIGPGVWLMSNALVTGSPFEPSHGARITIAETLLGYPNPNSRTGLLAVPDAFARDMGNWLRPVPLAVAAGGLLAGAALWPRAMRVPVAVGALNAVAFACLALIGLSIEQRYLGPTAAMLALLAAVGAVGWLAAVREPRERRPRDPVPRALAIVGVCAIAALVAELALDGVPRVRDARAAGAAENRLQSDLRDLVAHGPGRAAVRHASVVALPNPRLRPQVALWTGRDPAAFTTSPGARPAPGVLVAPQTPEAARYVGAAPAAAMAPPEYTRAAATRSWTLWRARPSTPPGAR
jgi:hypothetical protein